MTASPTSKELLLSNSLLTINGPKEAEPLSSGPFSARAPLWGLSALSLAETGLHESIYDRGRLREEDPEGRRKWERWLLFLFESVNRPVTRAHISVIWKFRVAVRLNASLPLPHRSLGVYGGAISQS